jgi:hypothetical protein
MQYPSLDGGHDLAGISLEPEPIEGLGHDAELHEKVPGQILWLRLAPLLLPEANQGGCIVAHNDPRIRTADE